MASSSMASGFKTGFGSAFLQFSFERLAIFGTQAWKEISVIWGVEDELRKLQRTFFKIQDLVDRLESSNIRFSSGSKAWQIWNEDLRKLAYDADALLDHVSLHISTYCAKSSINDYQGDQVRPMILASFQLDLPNEIVKMQKKLEDLAKEMKSLILIENLGLDFLKCNKTRETYYSGASFANKTSVLVDEEAIFGRQNEKDDIINQLLVNPGDVSVISIVGMGGIGKTTVAQLVYNDEEVHDKFKLRMWVSVSMDLNVMKITKTIIESVTQESCTLSDLNSLHVTLRKILADSVKFLLVLDDYWSEIDEEWEFLFAMIRHGCKGSKVIVTTRSNRVSTLVGSFKTYNLEILSDGDCWKLMKRRAFINQQENENFEKLGKEISMKCKGLPLAAKTIGSVLYHQFTEDEWRFILKSELWDLPREKNGIVPSLMLSYLHLPAHLQKCFSYCSIFPQNYEFEVKELVLLWMAEGFIQHVGEKNLEDIGEDYFSDLYMRSFFLQSKNSLDETVYKMHGLIHDLARFVSTDTCIQLKHEMSRHYPLFGNACHLSLHHDDARYLELKASHKNERLRTFVVMCKNDVALGLIDQKLFYNLKFVRVLGLSNIGISELPDSIEHLIYLRYLNLTGNTIQRLPKSICKLLTLQTLKLLNNPELIALPIDMKNLVNLRHLDFDIDCKLRFMPEEFGKLTNLQTLSAYIVRKNEGRGIEELKNMDNLRGSLSIKNLENVSNHADARDAKLEMKSDLTELKLLWEESDEIDAKDHTDQADNQESMLANLQPHKNLKELTIKKYSGSKCPNWLSDSTRKFTRIELQGLTHCTILPSFGELPLLKSLTIGEMPSLKIIDDNFYGNGIFIKFPSLVSLELCQMTELVKWIDSRSSTSMPRIESFKLHDCEKLVSLPYNLKSLPNRNVSRCGSLMP